MCKFRKALRALRNLHVDPLSLHTSTRNKQVEFNPQVMVHMHYNSRKKSAFRLFCKSDIFLYTGMVCETLQYSKHCIWICVCVQYFDMCVQYLVIYVCNIWICVFDISMYVCDI